jgi:hypothetical protein
MVDIIQRVLTSNLSFTMFGFCCNLLDLFNYFVNTIFLYFTHLEQLFLVVKVVKVVVIKINKK